MTYIGTNPITIVQNGRYDLGEGCSNLANSRHHDALTLASSCDSASWWSLSKVCPVRALHDDSFPLSPQCKRWESTVRTALPMEAG